MLKIVIFASGRGSNLQAILNAINSSNKKVVISGVVSNNKDCGAFEIARNNNISAYLVSDSRQEGFFTYDELSRIFVKENIDLIVLAGFLKKIPDDFVEFYENKIINIHPALLPSFGGKGMYGIKVHQAVLNSSAMVSGATVHFVNKVYDDGLIIAQESVDIANCVSADEIAERVLKIEHKLLPRVIDWFADGKISINKNRVRIAN
ncbi:MAG: phosphoribosylglycinamide formyltransferase [Bacteroidetes bacterium]|nr:phosphoribosylglycinamide formyltransferase [Bacteroidota bacterium]